MTNDVKLTEAEFDLAAKWLDKWLNDNCSDREFDKLNPIFYRLYALARLGLAYQWRDISSAPKDGTRILVFQSENLTAGHLEEIHVVEWVNLNEGMRGKPRMGWGVPGSLQDEQGGYYDIFPTHWLPLPPPPTEESVVSDVSRREGLNCEPSGKGESRSRHGLKPPLPSEGESGEPQYIGGSISSHLGNALPSPKIGELVERLHNADAGNYDIVCKEAAAALEQMEKDKDLWRRTAQSRDRWARKHEADLDEAQSTIVALRAEKGRLNDAAKALIDDVRSRYPDEGLRCPHMIELASVADVCVPFDRGPDFDGLWCQTHKRYWSDCSVEEKADD